MNVFVTQSRLRATRALTGRASRNQCGRFHPILISHPASSGLSDKSGLLNRISMALSKSSATAQGGTNDE